MEQTRIGVYVCWCGTNIAKMVDVQSVAKYIGAIPDVIVSRDYKYMCSDPGQDLIFKDIKENKLDRIVVAACSPRIHEATFRKAIEKAGLNPYMFQMANIREQDSWVHAGREEATSKAKSLISAAIKRLRYHENLEKRFVDINPATLIIGGGISGMSSALELANSGKKVFLIEKSEKLGGQLNNIDVTYPYFRSSRQLLEPIIDEVKRNQNIEIFLNTKLEALHGYVGNFITKFNWHNEVTEIEFGNIIVASGLKAFNPERIPKYCYKTIKDIYTSSDFEKKLQNGDFNTYEGKEPKNVAIIHCVGSRNKNYHSYCSRICCQTALKYINQIRSALPKANIFDIYSDMRAYSNGCEELYARTSTQNVLFLMFDPQNGLPVIKEGESFKNEQMFIQFKEILSGEEVELAADMVILMTAMEAHEDASDIAHLVGISKCRNDFFIEKHPKLDPVATTTDGVYIVGSCQGPKGIEESVNQAKAASARILASIAKGKTEVEVTTAAVNEDICCGCQTCVQVCPYSAIHFNTNKNVSEVNETICKGCGTCGSACPTGAIRSRHFTDKQIISQIEGLLEPEVEM